MHRRATLAAAACLSAVALTASAGTALADPSAPLSKTDIVGVGSDTTQYVMDAIATAYSSPPRTRKLGSWDAVPPPGGSTTIVTKTGCAPITRPNGGSAGVAALQADTTGCIDFARTISPKATDGTQNALTFFAYGRDGVSWATVPAVPARTPASLTTAQLAGIYTCQLTDWQTIAPALPSGTIKAKLPQVGSALRKTFLTRIGLSDSTVGSCVDQSVEQNKGTALANDPLAIVPHSVASYIAQTNNKIPDARSGIVLRSINSKKPITSTGKLNTAFDSNFLFLIYNVVKSPAPTKYTTIFGSGGFICNHPGTITGYGFGVLGSACGTVS